MEKKQTIFNQILAQVHVLIGKFPKQHVRKYVRNYFHAVKPPYTKHDIPHLVGTLVVFLIIFSVMNTITRKHTFASNPPVLPTKPQILVGTEHPLHIPFTHAEQGSVHIYWLSSTDPIGVSGYRVYRNRVKIGETTGTSFDDNRVSGKLVYTIEAYDPAGNASQSTLNLFLPDKWTENVSSSDSVISGFVLNKTDNSPISNTTITIEGGKTIHVAQNGYYYYVYPRGTDGQIQLTITAKGYTRDIEQITLTKGQSVSQTLYLNPQLSNGNGNSIQETIGRFLHKSL